MGVSILSEKFLLTFCINGLACAILSVAFFTLSKPRKSAWWINIGFCLGYFVTLSFELSAKLKTGVDLSAYIDTRNDLTGIKRFLTTAGYQITVFAEAVTLILILIAICSFLFKCSIFIKRETVCCDDS